VNFEILSPVALKTRSCRILISRELANDIGKSVLTLTDIAEVKPALRARVIGWLASATCATGFLLWARHQQIPRLPSSIEQIFALLLGVVAYTLATFGLCERWLFLLRRQASGFSRLAGYRPVVLGQLGNVFLPARAGDAIRVGVVATTHEEISMSSAVGALVAERALDIGCHAVLLVTVLVGMFGPSTGKLGHLPTILLGLALLLGAVIALRAVGGSLLSQLDIGPLVPKLLGPLLAPLIGLRYGSRAVIALSVAMWASEIGGWWAASHAVGLNLTLLQAAYVFAIASLALIVPVGFGAIGTLDAGIYLGIRTIGVSTVPVLSFVLLLRALFILPSLMMTVGITLGRRLARLKHAATSVVAHQRRSVDI
jgi:uncharacterized membrane protein YbhN (UPF0104 family)